MEGEESGEGREGNCGEYTHAKFIMKSIIL
jgi:hypothetical protein